MKRRLLAFTICTLALFRRAEATPAPEYSEQLHLIPLEDGKLLLHATFDLRVDAARVYGYEWGSVASYYDSGLLPRALAAVVRIHGIEELHLTLASGRYHFNDFTEQSPSGAELKVRLKNDAEYIPLVNSLAGLFCASINQLGKSTQNVFLNSTNTRHGLLPLEHPCTENLTPFKALLPCASLAGISQLLDPHKLFDAAYQKIGIHISTTPETVETRLELEMVKDPPREERSRGGKGRRDFNFKDLFGKTVDKACPVANSSKIRLSAGLFPPSPTVKYIPLLEEWRNEGDDLILDMKSDPLPSKIAVEWPSETAYAYREKAPITIERIDRGFGMERGVIGVRVCNNLDQKVDAIWSEELPWWIRLYMHTLKVSPCSSALKDLDYTPAIDRLSLNFIQAKVRLQPLSTCEITIDYDKAYLRYTEYPSDASRGFAVPPAMLEYKLDNDSKYSRTYTNTFFMMAPLPDFSMPYNVIVLTSTVMALLFGSVFNLLTRQFLAVDLQEEAMEKPQKEINISD